MLALSYYVVIKVFSLYYIIYSNEEWSSQLWSQFLQLRKEAWKKFRTSTGLEPVTSRIPVRRSTNWAMKPLTLGAGQLWVHMFPWKICKWMIHMKYIYIYIYYPVRVAKLYSKTIYLDLSLRVVASILIMTRVFYKRVAYDIWHILSGLIRRKILIVC